jgi:hypothetical protein
MREMYKLQGRASARLVSPAEVCSTCLCALKRRLLDLAAKSLAQGAAGPEEQPFHCSEAPPFHPGDFIQAESLEMPEDKEPPLQSGQYAGATAQLSGQFLFREDLIGAGLVRNEKALGGMVGDIEGRFQSPPPVSGSPVINRMIGCKAV